METPGKCQIITPNYKKMAESRLPLSNQNIVEQFKANAKKQKKTLKATQTWLNVCPALTTER